MPQFKVLLPGPELSGIYSNIKAWMYGFWKRAIAPAADDIEDWIETDFDFYFDELMTWLKSETDSFTTKQPSEINSELNELTTFIEQRFLDFTRKLLKIGGSS